MQMLSADSALSEDNSEVAAGLTRGNRTKQLSIEVQHAQTVHGVLVNKQEVVFIVLIQKKHL